MSEINSKHGSDSNLLKGLAKESVEQTISRSESLELTDAARDYYRAEFKQRLHKEMRRVFNRLSAEEGLTFTEIARRLRVNKSVITRRFSGHANLTLDVLSDVFRAMGGRLTCVGELKADMESKDCTWTVDSMPSEEVQLFADDLRDHLSYVTCSNRQTEIEGLRIVGYPDNWIAVEKMGAVFQGWDRDIKLHHIYRGLAGHEEQEGVTTSPLPVILVMPNTCQTS